MNTFRKTLIEAINKAFKIDIPNTEENQSTIDSIFSDIASDAGWGWCDDCDERRSDEPTRDESRD